MEAPRALAAILGAISILPAHAQPNAVQGKADPLSVEARIVGQKKCASESENSLGDKATIAFVTLAVDLQIRNVSDRKVILCKTCIEDGGPRLRVTSPDGNPGETIAEIQEDSFGFRPPPRFRGRSDANYVVLKPGDTYEARVSTNIVGKVASAYPPKVGQLSTGRYFLEGGFWSWSEPKTLTASFERRWRQTGELYDRGFETPPIPFEIDLAGLPACRSGP